MKTNDWDGVRARFGEIVKEQIYRRGIDWDVFGFVLSSLGPGTALAVSSEMSWGSAYPAWMLRVSN